MWLIVSLGVALAVVGFGALVYDFWRAHPTFVDTEIDRNAPH